MRLNTRFFVAYLGIIALMTTFAERHAKALTPATVVLQNSIKPVEATASTGSGNARQPYVSRSTLTSAESNAPLEFEVALKMRNLADLKARVNRGEHITPAEMAAKYDPLPADYEAVANWLTSEGFTITRRDPSHMVLFARGKIGHVAQALKVNFARVTMTGKEYTSAVTAPSVPGNISPFLIGINGLQPHLRAHKHLMKQQVQPNASSGSASYLPSQIAQAYNATALYNTNITGAGQTIAIVIDTFPSTTDLLLFWKNCNINESISNIQFVQAVPGILPAPSGEETLDTEWASAMAPGAHVRVYAATDLAGADLDQAYEQVYEDAVNHPEMGIHQMSMSYGEGETYYETNGQPDAQVTTDDGYFTRLAAVGVTVFASAGDGGATPGPNGAGDESGPQQVEFPASDPYVTGVGGTTLKLNSNNTVTSEVTWNNSDGASGGGASIFFSCPSWQAISGSPVGAQREVPDVACAADPEYGAVTYYEGAESTVGGTSWACPTWAAFCALINQARANAGVTPAPLGNLGPHLYPLLNTANYSVDIRDIISGNNDAGSGDGYNATPGYDLVSGIGVPLLQSLTKTEVGSSNLIGVQMAPPELLVSPGQNAVFSVTASGTFASYQWRRMAAGTTAWNNLSDGGAYSGSATASLTVTDATTAMNGDQFQCVITLGGNGVTTWPSVLTVENPLIVSSLAGQVGTSGLQNGMGTSATFAYPSGIAIDSSGNLYIADFNNNNIRKVTTGGMVSTPYGSTTGLSGSTNSNGNNARFLTPNSIAADSSNNLYVADTGNSLIRKISAGTVSTLAGSGGQFNLPEGIAVDGSGNVYVADTGNDTIEKVTPGGTVTIIAGQTGNPGYADGPATSAALFSSPSSVAVDGSGNVYVADFGNFVIRKITVGTSMVSTVAGQAGVGGYLDGPGNSALFNTPSGLAIDGSNNLYVADSLVPPPASSSGPVPGFNAAGNDLVRKITPSGIVSTLAGQAGEEGASNGTGTGAQFFSVQAVALNPINGNIYLADTYNQTLRMAVPTALPTISLSATQSTAVVFGPIPGQFTVTRTGDLSGSLTINYSLAGTAVNSTDYSSLPGTVTIPAEESSAVISVNPIEHSQATTSPTVLLTLGTPPTPYAINGSNTATVTIQELTPFQSWENLKFPGQTTNPNVVGPNADPNHNGVPNFLEYAFNSDPNQVGTEPLPVISVVESGGEDYLAITYTQLDTDPDLVYTVQVTSDLTQQNDQWHSGTSYTTFVSQVSHGNTTQITVRDSTPLSSVPKRFIRVEVSGD